MDANAPIFSVLIPLTDARDHARECLDSWLRQTFNPSQFELILIQSSSDLALAEYLRPSLRPNDRIVGPATGRETDFWQVGSSYARGTWLFLTEAHCLADPRCLDEMSCCLDAHRVAGACARSVPIANTMLAQHDAACFTEGFTVAVRDDSWRKLIVHGVALCRRQFQELGGFAPRYGRFAEWVFQARLHREGMPLGYAPRAVIHHVYRETLSELVPEIESYTRGECQYRDDFPLERISETTCWPPEWSEGYEPNTRLAHRMARTLFHAGLKQPSTLGPGRLGDIFRLATRTQTGRCVRAWFVKTRAMWQAWRGRNDSNAVDASYRRFKEAIVTWARYRYLANRPKRPPTYPLPVGEVKITDLPEESLVGFYCRERFKEGMFRWSQSVAAIEFDLAPSNYRITLDTAGVRGDARPWLGEFYFNHRRIDKVETDSQGFVRFQLNVSEFVDGPQMLLWTCVPLKRSGGVQRDPRELGLPLRAVEIRPVDRLNQKQSHRLRPDHTVAATE